MSSTRNLRNFNLNLFCFSNNSTTTPESKPPPNNRTSIVANSETPSHHSFHHNNTTPCPSPSIMIKNFNSLYDPTLTFDHSFYSSSFSTTITTTTSTEPEPEPDLAAAFASKRFFFSSPGHSNSLMKYTNTKTTNCTTTHNSSSLMANTTKDKSNGEVKKKKKMNKVLFNGSVAVPTDSPDPYLDFRRSMQEMVEARPELMDVKSNWNVLHELLLCYLALNPKSTHKFILGAFSDLLVSLLPF